MSSYSVSIRRSQLGNALTLVHSWGHLRPALTFASYLLTLVHDLHITIIYNARLSDSADTELERFGMSDAQKIRLTKLRFGSKTSPVHGSGPLGFVDDYQLGSEASGVMKAFLYP